MLKILHRHVLFEFLRNFAVVFFILVFMLVAGRSLKYIHKGFDLFLLMKLMVYILPTMMPFALPISTLAATVLTFSRMAGDNEVIAIRSAGINIWKLCLPLFAFAILSSLLTYTLVNDMLPRFKYYLFKVERGALVHLFENRVLAGEKVIKMDDYVVHIGSVDKQTNKLIGLVIQRIDNDKLVQQIEAASATMPKVSETNSLVGELYDARAINLVDEKAPVNIGFSNYNIAPRSSAIDLVKRHKDMTNGELLDLLAAGKIMDYDLNKVKTILHTRYATAASCIVFLLLGLVMGVMGHHGNRLIGFALSLMIVFMVYYPIMLGMDSVCKSGKISPLIGVWIPNMVLLGVSGFFMKRMQH